MIVAVGNKSRVGKDTFADYLVNNYGFKRISIAESLYKLSHQVQDFFGIEQHKDPKLLQELGTCMRKIYGDNIWIDKAVAEIKSHNGNVVISDMRFKNECGILKQMSAYTVKVTRRDRIIDRDPLHISEVDLDDYTFDYTIENNGTKEEFYAAIDDFVSKIGIKKK